MSHPTATSKLDGTSICRGRAGRWARGPLGAGARGGGAGRGGAGGGLGQQPVRGQRQHVFVAAVAVVGGHEVVADREREGEHAAGLRLVLIA
jgi:hypothetical protein